MISKQEIMRHAQKLRLAPNIIEKDYVLNWMLAGIASQKDLNKEWVFKGGTCLKKCFFKNYRFSEDLDFTLIDAKHINVEFLEAKFKAISEWIYDQSGIEIPTSHVRFEIFKNVRGNLSVAGRVGYQGPMKRRGDLSRIKLDLTNDEKIVLKPSFLEVYHPYSDVLNGGIIVQTYCLEEIFAEKLRALTDRLRPRDLYDVVHLHYDTRWQADRKRLITSLRKKCDYKQIVLPTMELLSAKSEKRELITEWDNMLAHQLSDVLPFDYYWDKLSAVLNWVHGDGSIM